MPNPTQEASPAPVAMGADFGKNLAERIQEAHRLIREAAVEAASLVREGPENPKIKRLTPLTFTMSSSDLGSDWSPFFHDWPAQYLRLADLILDQQFGKLHSILETGVLRDRPGKSERFAPEVVARLKNAVGDLTHVEVQENAPQKRSLRMR